MLCALIMAGGKGTRFWPLSTEEKPKQFLNLIGKQTMIQMTVNRVLPIIPIERIFVCTGKQYVHLVKDQLPELPERNIIVEPEGRNTAPCIALSAFIIKRYYEDATMVVLPSDHLIKDEEEFRKIVESSKVFINKNKEAMVTLGMKPSRAETGYGYIKCGKSYQELSGGNIIKKVDSFVEKPSKEKAKRYLEEGNYIWNGGMFLWSTDNILSKIKKYCVATYEALQAIDDVELDKMQDLINQRYKETEAISIDYAVLEKSEDIYVVPSNFGWDDVGSWEALDRYRDRDNNGNILVGKSKAIKARNNLIMVSNNEVIVNEVNNIYVIEENGKIIIGNKSNISKIKDLKDML